MTRRQAASSLKVLRPGDVQDEHHAVDSAARDVGRAMDDARLIQQFIPVVGLAAPLEEGHIMVAQGLRLI